MCKSCTFFGHRDCPGKIKSKLREALIDLIENKDVEMFYVGNQGQFDALVCSTLRELMQIYPHINYAVVLERIPSKREEYMDYSDTMLPEEIESVHPRYDLSWRNKWMLDYSDYVVIYITHSWGGAAQFAEKAKRRGKLVINIADLLDV